MVDEEPWYSELRERWRPKHVRLLLIAESAPDDRGDPARRRFFYADSLGPDNLFGGVVAAMYGATRDDLKRDGKRPWLERLREDGFYLIDLAPFPVNVGLSTGARRQVLRASIPGCVDRARALSPDGIVVVKKNLHRMLAGPLRDAGLPLLHNEPIAFPLPEWRPQFIAGLNAARALLPAT
jgi:hypothetical protein